MTSSESGDMSAAATLSSTCAGFLQPGMAQATVGCMRIQRRANCARVFPSGTSSFSSSAALSPVSKSTPANVSPLSKACPSRLKLRWSSSVNARSERILPERRPLARGTRARMPTLRPSASGKNVEDDLDGRDARIIEGHPRLLDLLHAHAVITKLSCFLQPVQRLEGRVLTVDFRWRAVELQQVQGFDPEVVQATLDEGREVVVIVSFRSVGIQASSGLGRDQDLIVRAVLHELGDYLLAASVAVDVRRIEEVHPEVDRAVQSGVGVVLTYSTPVAPECPGAEADLRDTHPRLPEVSISQSPVLSRYSLFQSVAPDDLRVPAGARLGDAQLRSVFHEHDTEPLGVPFGPLEVIQERPHHVTAQVDAPIHRLVGCPEVSVQVGDALLVVHVALGVYVVADGTPVLGYVDGQVCIFFLDPDQYLRQAFRLHRPAHSSLLRRVRDNRMGVEVGEGDALPMFLRSVADGVTEVVVDTQEVDGNGDTDEIIVVDEREVYAPLS